MNKGPSATMLLYHVFVWASMGFVGFCTQLHLYWQSIITIIRFSGCSTAVLHGARLL